MTKGKLRNSPLRRRLRRLWNEWFGWRTVKLPIVRRFWYSNHDLITIPTELIEVRPLNKPSGLLFYLDFEVRTMYIDKGIDFTAKQIVKGII
jgi:hypothetical protein